MKRRGPRRWASTVSVAIIADTHREAGPYHIPEIYHPLFLFLNLPLLETLAGYDLNYKPPIGQLFSLDETKCKNRLSTV